MTRLPYTPGDVVALRFGCLMRRHRVLAGGLALPPSSIRPIAGCRHLCLCCRQGILRKMITALIRQNIALLTDHNDAVSRTGVM